MGANMRTPRTALCFVLVAASVLYLSACTRPGRPDLIYEEAGDMGRYYSPANPPPERWRVRRTTRYWLSEDRYQVIEGHQATEWGPMDEHQRREVECILRGLATPSSSNP